MIFDAKKRQFLYHQNSNIIIKAHNRQNCIIGVPIQLKYHQLIQIQLNRNSLLFPITSEYSIYTRHKPNKTIHYIWYISCMIYSNNCFTQKIIIINKFSGQLKLCLEWSLQSCILDSIQIIFILYILHKLILKKKSLNP